MSSESFTCPHHGFLIATDSTEGCPECVEMLTDAPDADLLVPSERQAEFDFWINGSLTAPVSVLMHRIQQLVGRAVFIHELALNLDGLRDETLLTERPRQADLAHVVGMLEDAGKEVIILSQEDE